MKTFTALSALLTATGLAQAHYTFDRLAVNGQTVGSSWEYIRENTRQEKYMPTKFKNTIGNVTPNDNDFRCNEGSFTNAGKTKVYEVAPGDELSMILAYGAKMEHPGPAQIYMSKAPGSVTSYQGEGDWFKIKEEIVCGSTADGLQDTDWCTWGKDRLTFSIPQGTPAGEYLVRAEHVGLHRAHVDETEFYYACAQVKVTGNGSGTPSPVVKFPGAYKATDPGISFSIWNNKPNYPYNIGPAVWAGGASTGGTTPAISVPASGSAPAPTTLQTSTRPATSSVQPAPTNGGSAPAAAAKWQQCGGQGFTGPTTCQSGSTCKVQNPWYSQCL
ncbi:putative endo-beta-1,4-glucanase D [Cyphellophora attinorum]|uniref:AA9 family lytic polysaccharide monooxygenase n=1 Tax=Cyphellophora attinorum TaxID=1664694 RepID=A0A0N1HYF7_9EURO|nr:putative endo-beta-1,4-glucanase D [Phialophora attinorum]KPI45856.1 putative endo-beta-1,4-glucanase D [Phialophora attinorum]